MKHILAITTMLSLFALPGLALAGKPLAATVTVYNGSTYDYVIIGEQAGASDGYDPLYDILAPGASLNATWISAYINHPEWNQAKSQFRGDIRSIAEKQEWMLTVTSSLPAGTPVTIALNPRTSFLPADAVLQLSDSQAGKAEVLNSGFYTFTWAGAPRSFIITATRPQAAIDDNARVVADNLPNNGDTDGDGFITIFDAVKVLLVSYGLTTADGSEMDRGDVDGDGVLRLADALSILRKVAGTI